MPLTKDPSIAPDYLIRVAPLDEAGNTFESAPYTFPQAAAEIDVRLLPKGTCYLEVTVYKKAN